MVCYIVMLILFQGVRASIIIRLVRRGREVMKRWKKEGYNTIIRARMTRMKIRTTDQ